MTHAKQTCTQKVRLINAVATILLDIHTTVKMEDEIVALEKRITPHHWSVAAMSYCQLVRVRLRLWKQLQARRLRVHVKIMALVTPALTVSLVPVQQDILVACASGVRVSQVLV